MSQRGFQLSPRTIAPMVVCATPKRAPNSLCKGLGEAAHAALIAATSSTDNLRRRLGCRNGQFTRSRPVIGASDGRRHVLAVAILLIVLVDTLKRSAIARAGSARSASIALIDATSAGLNACLENLTFPGIGLRARFATAWSMFSWLVHHSKLDGVLFALFRSLWFTRGFSNGAGPTNTTQTIRCTWWNTWRPSALYRPIRRYPQAPSLSFKFFRCTNWTLPTLVTLVRATEAIRPRLLTSYRPSYPGTGFQISCSISNSFRWLCGLTGAEVTGASKTPGSLGGQAQKQTRPSPWLTFSVAR